MLALLIFALWAVSARAVAIVKREDVSCEMVFSGPLALLSLDRPTVWNVSNEQAAENFNALVVQSPGLSQLQVEFQKFTGFPAGWPDQCLFTGELIVGESSSYVIEVGNCSYADDSSQLSQYWSLGQNWDDASMDLFFLGRSVNGTTLISGETSYQYVLNDFEDTQAIEVWTVFVLNADGIYSAFYQVVIANQCTIIALTFGAR
ncbi:predicted protein [Postia placenta Mad-698-R]|nr:predicted protein [Postia placenta Mad-698-R]